MYVCGRQLSPGVLGLFAKSNACQHQQMQQESRTHKLAWQVIYIATPAVQPWQNQDKDAHGQTWPVLSLSMSCG